MGKRPTAAQRAAPLAHIPAWLCGAAGGAVSAFAQFIGNTLNETLGFCFDGQTAAAMINIADFLIAALFTAACGVPIAFFLQAKTENRWTLFLAGITATSIGTMAVPGFAKFIKRADLAPISIAYAQTSGNPCAPLFSVSDGLKQFFRIENPTYRVIVGSFKSNDDAKSFAAKVNTADSSLNAIVGDRALCNDYYPVFVGSSTTSLDTAKQVQKQANQLNFISDAYISKRL